MDYSRLCINCMREKTGDSHVCSHCGFDDRTYAYPPFVLQPFTPLNGKYIIGRMLGSGGFGITYIAIDTALERVVAVKEFFVQQSMYRHNTVSSDVTVSNMSSSQEKVYEVNRIKFEQEAKTLARLTDMPGIVRVYDFFRENNTSYMVLEYLSGMTLKDYVKRQGGRLSFDEVIRKLTPVMTSLDLLHKTVLASDVSQGSTADGQTGIIHRDISPDNIMVSEEGKLTLFDFGGAKIQHEVKSYVVLAKAGYSPIEQLQAADEIGPWVDVYAMAATIYYCLCGHIPAEATRRASDKDALVKPSQEGVVITPRQEQVLLKGLALRYKDRYLSMGEFRDALAGNSQGAGGGSGNNSESGGNGNKGGGGSKLPLIVIPIAVLAFAVGGILAVRNLNRPASGPAELETEEESESRIRIGTDQAAENVSGTETETEEPETEAETQAETKPETEGRTEAETEAETETRPEPGTVTEPRTEVEETEATESGPEPQTETEPRTESRTDTAKPEEAKKTAQDIVQEYNLGLLTYNEAAAQMENSDSPEEGKAALDELKSSKEAYRRGSQYVLDGATAKEAVEEFASVTPEDVNYQDAQDQIQEIYAAQAQDCKSDVESFTAGNQYREALDRIEEAQELLPEDTELEDLRSQTVDEYSAYALEQADELMAANEFDAARTALNEAFTYTGDEELLDKLAEVTTRKQVSAGAVAETEAPSQTPSAAETEAPQAATEAAAPSPQSEEGIHRYELYFVDGSWTDAFQACLDNGGYLVHINSQEEMDYLISELEALDLRGTRFYVGARREETAALYYWVDENNSGYGDPINYESWWLDGEPSLYDIRGNEQYAEDVVELYFSESENRWVLNDIPNNLPAYLPNVEYKLGFICEYNETQAVESQGGDTQTGNTQDEGAAYSAGWYQITDDYDAGIAVRTGPSAKEDLLGRVPQGTMFYVDEVSGVWGYATAGEYTGWINLDYASAAEPPSVQKEIGWYRIASDYDAGIAVRTGPSAKEELLGRIPQGTPFYVDATCDVWGHTTVNGYTGWIHLDYAEEI